MRMCNMGYKELRLFLIAESWVNTLCCVDWTQGKSTQVRVVTCHGHLLAPQKAAVLCWLNLLGLDLCPPMTEEEES